MQKVHWRDRIEIVRSNPAPRVIRADLSIRFAARRNTRLKFVPLTAARDNAFIPDHTGAPSNLGKIAPSPPL
jgi:hypothetical protein